MAPNVEYVARAVCAYLAERLAVTITWVDELPWAERYQALDAGEIDVAWICGAPYQQRAQQAQPTVALLAAPVWRGAPYGDRPVYFSAVVVRADAPYQQWADLRGAKWGYNEPNSFSGYHVVTHQLATLGEQDGYFGWGIRVGSHQQALRLVARGDLDVAAIDSTVLAQALVDEPALATQVRTLLLLGPNPMPPWVISTQRAVAEQTRLRQALLEMSATSQGKIRLAATPLARFAPVTPATYQPIAHLLELTRGVCPAQTMVAHGP